MTKQQRARQRRLRDEFNKSGISQKELAGLAKCSPTHVRTLLFDELPRWKTDTLERVEKALGISENGR